jgi:hypothetical protein
MRSGRALQEKIPANEAVRRSTSPRVFVPDSACLAGGRGLESRRSRKIPANMHLLLPVLTQSTAGLFSSRADPARESTERPPVTSAGRPCPWITGSGRLLAAISGRSGTTLDFCSGSWSPQGNGIVSSAKVPDTDRGGILLAARPCLGHRSVLSEMSLLRRPIRMTGVMVPVPCSVVQPELRP